jgi:RNA polymerase sigma-70 factor (ECF subfamily)
VREDRNLDLVIRARDGDLDAFESLVYEHTPTAYRLAASIAGESLAGDVVQDSFLAAWRELPHLRDPARFGQWLHRIVVNRSRSILRARRGVREIPVNSLHDASLRAEVDGLVVAEARAVVASSFKRLSLDQRTLLGLHYAVGLSIREVAAILEIPVGTAKSRLAATLASLRDDIGGDGR